MSAPRPFAASDLDALIQMRMQLFPDCNRDDQRAELQVYFDVPRTGEVGNAGCFVVADDAGELVGFAEVMLRSHAEGGWEHTTGGRMGVACLEAWWVNESARKSGVGRALVAACERWAMENGSPVLASDALLDNAISQTAHRALGFDEVERSVHYVKKLGSPSGGA